MSIGREISELEAEIGYPPYDFSENEARRLYALERLRALSKKARGKTVAGIENGTEAELISLIENCMKG